MANSNAPSPSVSTDNQTDSTDEQRVIDEITLLLKAEKDVITNKDIILALIGRMGAENDVVQNDILRNALEMIIRVTPDDL
ncbi:hypothetical protein IAE49_10800 [Kosakonia sp. S58]|uniref:biofilm development regulator YmgB/AriR family protein n=1 Tax=unclassified Kosakonia TaxID=2632876 RepID=UPI001905B5D2|nr:MULTISPECIES: biofilm development regulator YmgB/AriR family protein [unclassified Kosakonia]MBK0079767.1 hypothetical protein [Kosakonia sp. S57]MBK0086723.1 hypothetical protein [Kosakonia sp. S58]